MTESICLLPLSLNIKTTPHPSHQGSESTTSPYGSSCFSSPVTNEQLDEISSNSHQSDRKFYQLLGYESPVIRRKQDVELSIENTQGKELLLAVENNNTQYIDMTMSSVETSMDLNEVRDKQTGYSLLHIASAANSVDVVAALVERYLPRVAVDVRCLNFHQTPLHRAALKGHLQVVKTLLDAGALVDAVTQWGCTAVHLAATNGHFEVVEELLNRGGLIDTVTQFGSRPLLSATYNLHGNVLSLLLSRGSYVNQQNKKGLTALHLAVQRGSYPLIVELLQYNANTTLTDDDGKTALDMALDKTMPKKIIDLLQSVSSVASGVSVEGERQGGSEVVVESLATGSGNSSSEGVFNGLGTDDEKELSL